MPLPLKVQIERGWKRAKRFRPQRGHVMGAVLVAAVVAGTAVTLPRPNPPAPAAPRTVTAVKVGGPFALIGPGGGVVTQNSFPGKYLLVFFGYTFCPDVCPTTLTNVSGALAQLGPLADRVQPLFITVDPARDTLDVMVDYAAHFDSRIVPLTGSADAIKTAEQAYRVYAAPYRTGDGADDYLMDHSAVVYLMDPKGDFLAMIDAASAGPQMAAEMKPYLTDTSARNTP